MKAKVIKKSTLLSHFHDSGKQIFYVIFRDPLFFRFVNSARDPTCATLKQDSDIKARVKVL